MQQNNIETFVNSPIGSPNLGKLDQQQYQSRALTEQRNNAATY